MIHFDGLDQAIENIGYRMGHSTPVGNHGNAQRIVEESLGGQFHAFQEDFDGRPFLVSVERETIDGGIVFVSADRFLCSLQIRRPQGLKNLVRQDDTFARQIPEERLRDVDAHLEEAGIGVLV